MKKVLMKATALFLVIALLLTNGIAAFADAPAVDDPLISVREFFEESGGEVTWDDDNRRITATLEDDTFILYPLSTRAYRNETPVNLTRPIIMQNNIAYIFISDLLILFGLELEAHLPLTIAQTMEMAPVLMEMFGVPGMTIALVDAQNDFTWVQGFGYADSAAGVPVDEYTLFSLGSISKPFTAIAVMQLVEDGLIDLDEPIVTYLPDFYLPSDPSGLGDYRNITVRMLMSHASGILPSFLASGMFSHVEADHSHMNNFLELLAQFPMSTPEEFMYSYANNAFTLLGVLVAAIATDYDSHFEGFVSYTQDNIFTPAGMGLSTFEITERHLPHISQSYATTGVPEDFVFIGAAPTGGLMSNAADMAQFMHIILSGGEPLLSQNSLRQMFTRQNFNMASGIDFLIPNMEPALGFIYTTDLAGFTRSGHGGNIIHFHSYMALDLDTGIGVMISVNSITGMPLPSDLAAFMLTSAIQERTGTLNLPVSDPSVEPIEMDFDALQVFEGFYSILGGTEFGRILASEEGHLYLYGLMPTAMTLVPLSDGSFVCPETTLRFWMEEAEGEFVIVLGEFQSMLLGLPLDPGLVTAPEGFERWIGTYEIVLEQNQVSNLVRLSVGIDDNGFAYILTSTLNGASSIMPLIALGEYNFEGGISFGQDDDGTWLTMADGHFLRVE
ncbi:MAG: serine hydrolase [Defluviitaleaceae bacterium]|nr:serine hydrolase [Defluviitaleaceae bacterium]